MCRTNVNFVKLYYVAYKICLQVWVLPHLVLLITSPCSLLDRSLERRILHAIFLSRQRLSRRDVPHSRLGPIVPFFRFFALYEMRNCFVLLLAALLKSSLLTRIPLAYKASCICCCYAANFSSLFRRGVKIGRKNSHNFIDPTSEKNNRRLTFSGNCSDGTQAVPFEAYTLLTITGRPNLVSGGDLSNLEQSFVVAYNQLQNCSMPSGANRILDNATIISTSAMAAATNVSSTASTVSFTFLFKRI